MFNKQLKKKIAALESFLGIAFVENSEYESNYYLTEGYGKMKDLDKLIDEKNKLSTPNLIVK